MNFAFLSCRKVVTDFFFFGVAFMYLEAPFAQITSCYTSNAYQQDFNRVTFDFNVGFSVNFVVFASAVKQSTDRMLNYVFYFLPPLDGPWLAGFFLSCPQSHPKVMSASLKSSLPRSTTTGSFVCDQRIHFGSIADFKCTGSYYYHRELSRKKINGCSLKIKVGLAAFFQLWLRDSSLAADSKYQILASFL
jgi:hypothetical protein